MNKPLKHVWVYRDYDHDVVRIYTSEKLAKAFGDKEHPDEPDWLETGYVHITKETIRDK